MTDLKREDVARVLAEAWWGANCAADCARIRSAAAYLGIRPEFESALKALEAKNDPR